MSPAARPRLGDILLRAGLVDDAGLQRALERQRVQPGRIGTHLLELGAVKGEDLAKALSIQHRVPPFLPDLYPPDPGAIARVPEALARRRRALPVAWDEDRGTLQVALADPQDLEAVDELRFAAGARRVAVLVAPEQVIEREIARRYRGEEPEPAGPLVSPAIREAEPAPSRPGPRALVADPSGRRGRAVAALLEAEGFRVTRPRTRDEAARAWDANPWDRVWVHADWAEGAPAGALVYRSPADEWAQALGPVEAFAREAEALAREAVPPARRTLADEVAALLRLAAGRRRIGGWELRWLLLRFWRAAGRDWDLPDGPTDAHGADLLAVAAAFGRARERTGSAREAVRELGRDETLVPAAVTEFARLASGTDLLERLGDRPRALAVFPSEEAPEGILAALEAAGWEVTRAGEPVEDGDAAAVLVPAGRGVEWIEAGAFGRGASVFVVGSFAHPAEALYALRAGAEDVIDPATHPELVVAKLERAASRARPAAAGVEGSLADLSVAEVVQVLAHGLRTAVVTIEGPRGSGEIALERGRVVDARAGALRGEDAVYELVTWEEGRFRIAPGLPPDRPRTVENADTEGLLMEGFRRLDEARRGADGAD